ncbi:hypothetical protein NIIDMKKI_61570 [Mycobacterium kansasii]|uniref:Uncharacterized protein n=1 Tax=Mycobacterium kansasii TaxID=1768 RepID=A0A7G1IIV9_MYCKA|nr:hypothetical protein NIIDMKKI_61570 [Mycobacterium kansasii]
MQRAAAGGATLIDIVAYPFILDLDAVLEDNPPDTFGTYHNRVKLGGVKVTLDGSPQGRTAFFTTPTWSTDPTDSRTGPASSRSRRKPSTPGSKRSTTSVCR